MSLSMSSVKGTVRSLRWWKFGWLPKLSRKDICQQQFEILQNSLKTEQLFFHPYLWDLVDVKKLRELDAEHVCGQSDGSPPSLTHLPQPGLPPLAEDNPDRVVKHRDPDPLSQNVWLPSQAAAPALAPPACNATSGPDPPPHWKHCRDTITHTMRYTQDRLKYPFLLRCHLYSGAAFQNNCRSNCSKS